MRNQVYLYTIIILLSLATTTLSELLIDDKGKNMGDFLTSGNRINLEEIQTSDCEGLLDMREFNFRPEEDSGFRLSAVSDYLFLAHLEPFCVRYGIDYYRLMIGLKVSGVDSIRVYTGVGKNVFCYCGSKVDSLVLYDDETHGDDMGGDSVFTIDSLSPAITEGWEFAAVSTSLRTTTLRLFYAGGLEELISEELDARVMFIHPDSVPIPTVIDVAADVRATDHCVAMLQDLRGEFPEHSAYTADAGRRYYEFFPDDRDFLGIALPFSTAYFAAMTHGILRNDVTGIGINLRDDSQNAGSDGVLRGITTYYHGLAGIDIHELLHQWANFLDQSLDLGLSHWGQIERPSSGFGCGNNYFGSWAEILVDTGGTYKCRQPDYDENKRLYNDLELYLMGLIPASEVELPIRTLVNPVFIKSYGESDEGIYYTCAQYTADSIREVSMEEIIAIEGERTPSHLTSPKHYNAALIVIYPRLLTDIEMAYFDYVMREAEGGGLNSFEWATGGRATVSALLEIPMMEHICGDANGDEEVNVGDAVFLINYVFKDGPAPDPQCMGDANGDSRVNVGDAVYIVTYVFRDGPAPIEGCCP